MCRYLYWLIDCNWAEAHRWWNGTHASLQCDRSSVRAQVGSNKNYEIGICRFSTKDAALRNKSQVGFAWNQDNVSEWDMSTNLFRWETVYTKSSPVNLITANINFVSFLSQNLNSLPKEMRINLLDIKQWLLDKEQQFIFISSFFYLGL